MSITVKQMELFFDGLAARISTDVLNHLDKRESLHELEDRLDYVENQPVAKLNVFWCMAGGKTIRVMAKDEIEASVKAEKILGDHPEMQIVDSDFDVYI